MSLVGFTLGKVMLLLMLTSVLAPWQDASAQPLGPSPSLMRAAVTRPASGMVIVEGQGFTPGGAVHLYVYDRRGEDVYQDVWTVASVETYGPGGSADPAQGFSKGGVVRHLFSFVSEVTYGPNGSQDPAYGFSRADAQIARPQDGQDLMVRAYDLRSQSWSNVLDVKVFDPEPAQADRAMSGVPQCHSAGTCWLP